MKKIFAIISLAALMMPVSCMKDEMFGPDVNGPASKVVSFTAVMEGSDTKTTLNETTGAVAWAVGDAVKFDYEIQKVDSEPVVSSSLAADDINTGTATFNVEIPDVFSMTGKEYNATLDEGTTPSRHLYVVYPASVVTEYVYSGYTVTIPAVQDGKFESASISLAKWNISEPTAPLDFRNLCGLLQVKVADENVRQIKVSSNDYIAGRANVGFAENVPFDPYIKNMYDDGASKTITVNVDGAGTYYIAVAPGTLKEFYVELFGENKTALGDRLAKSEITVERAHVLPLGTLGTGSFAGEGGFFVKPVADGTGDGSSWDNAADYNGLHSKLDNSKTNNTAVTMAVYMAAGTYEVAAQLNVTPAHNVKIYGGYPADAKGMSLADRDPSKNVTVLDGKDAVKIWNLTAGTWAVDGLTFQNASHGSGSAITLQKTVDITVTDCVFKDNVATGAGGAAVLCQGVTSDKVLFEDCKFIGNKATTTSNGNTGLGGAIMGSSLPTNPGTITLLKCLFQENSAALGGGAICPRTMHCRVLDCTFVDNTGASYGDAIYLENAAKVTTYCDGCNFYYTKSAFVTANDVTKNATISVNNSNTVLGLSNCVVSGPWAGKTAQLMALNSKSVVVVNSTLFAQTSYPLVLVQGGNVNIINSIALNAASKGAGRGIANQASTSIYNTILTKADEKVDGSNVEVTRSTDMTVYNNNLKVVSNTAETFPVAPTWYGNNDHAGVMWGNKNAKTTTVDDCRGKLYYYAWDGVYPEGATFTNATLEQVTQMVTAADAGFATWLGDRLGKDIRGKARDTQSMWPGSYQE